MTLPHIVVCTSHSFKFLLMVTEYEKMIHHYELGTNVLTRFEGTDGEECGLIPSTIVSYAVFDKDSCKRYDDRLKEDSFTNGKGL